MIIKINKKIISNNSKTYFIADIAANHDGSLKRAKKLIALCAKAGADAAKFQHFKANTIVNKKAFNQIKLKTHQSKWKKSVFQVYKEASINNKWNKELKKECDKFKIDFLTSPYDLDYIDDVNKYIPAFKIGSGDINWKESLVKIAKKNKPVIIASGASSFVDVKNAIKTLKKYNKKIILMQCNTNYTNSEENFKYINLNVLKTYKKFFKNNVILGLSDHTPGHSTVLGAISLGARVIEKHFTDNNSRQGPDHKFSMNPFTWKNMVDETRRLENALGNGIKKIEKNEKNSFFVQRRGVYAAQQIKKGQKFNKKNTCLLRPFNKNSFNPFMYDNLLGKKAKKSYTHLELIKKNA